MTLIKSKPKAKARFSKSLLAKIAKYVPKRPHTTGGAPGISRLFPKRKFMKCGYECTHVLTKANNVNLAMVHFRLNSIYDPEYNDAGKNTAVAGYAQMSAIYGTYKVYSGSIYVQAENNCAVPVPVGLYFQNDVTSTLTSHKVSDVTTRQGGIMRLLGYLGKSNQSMYKKFDVKKQYGINKLTFSDSLFGSAMGTSPSSKLYALVALGEVGDGATVQTSIVLRVKVVMNVVLMDPIELITVA